MFYYVGYYGLVIEVLPFLKRLDRLRTGDGETRQCCSSGADPNPHSGVICPMWLLEPGKCAVALLRASADPACPAQHRAVSGRQAKPQAEPLLFPWPRTSSPNEEDEVITILPPKENNHSLFVLTRFCLV